MEALYIALAIAIAIAALLVGYHNLVRPYPFWTINVQYLGKTTWLWGNRFYIIRADDKVVTLLRGSGRWKYQVRQASIEAAMGGIHAGAVPTGILLQPGASFELCQDEGMPMVGGWFFGLPKRYPLRLRHYHPFGRYEK